MKDIVVLFLAVCALAACFIDVRQQVHGVHEEFHQWQLLVSAKELTKSDDGAVKIIEEGQWRRYFGLPRLGRVQPSKNNERDNVQKLLHQGYAAWKSYKELYGKVYTNESEEIERLRAFLKAQRVVREHNAAYKRGEKDFYLDLNHIADLLPEEYRQLNGFLMQDGDTLAKVNHTTFLTPLNTNILDNIDWRKSGYVTPVKNQGNCGSCWSFSATGSVEGQHMRKTGQLVSLSEQNLIDCSTDYGNDGCNGGLPSKAFMYIKDNGGIDTEQSYPYVEEVPAILRIIQNGQCRFNKQSVGAVVTGIVSIDQGSEEQLKDAVATVGPVSVGIDASQTSFHFYKGGIYYDPACSSTRLNHAVLVVGYGTDNGKDYWIVKNSWGERWGDQGYMKMARNKDNHCGIATMANYPLV